MIPKNRKPTHPGEILLEEFLKPSEISQIDLAKKMKVPVQRVNTLINPTTIPLRTHSGTSRLILQNVAALGTGAPSPAGRDPMELLWKARNHF